MIVSPIHILHIEGGMNWGGQEYRTVLENIFLNQNGQQSWLVCDPESEAFRMGTLLGARMVSAPMSRRWFTSLFVLCFCWKNRVHIINVHDSKGYAVSLPAFLSGIPLLRSLQITHPIKHSFAYRHLCSHVIATAEKIREMLLAKGVSSRRISVLGEGVDLQEFRPMLDIEALRSEFRFGENDQIVLNVAMIRKDKGQQDFLAAFLLLKDEFPNCKFILVGKGTGECVLEKKLRAQVEAAGISDRFLMPGYRNDIAAFMNLSTLVAVTSTRYEAQSRVVPQAFACARTVISTDIGGLPELVHHEQNGLLIKPHQPAMLADAVRRLLLDDELRGRLARKGHDMAIAKLSFGKMMDDTMKVYRKFRPSA